MIRIARDALAQIIEHAEASYPQECCGFLVGRTVEGVREAALSRSAQNANRERPHDRYQINPREYVALEKSLSGTGLGIVGFYHSHPDHRAVPSAYDEEMAELTWPTPALSYLIVAVRRGDFSFYSSWVWSQEKKGFERERVEELAE
jgi:proteasome lid subunit RPN8/RPN11